MAAVDIVTPILEALAGGELPTSSSKPRPCRMATGAYTPPPAPSRRPHPTAPVNYVHHSRAAHRKLLAAAGCRPYHVSTYWASFHRWNEERFPNRLRIDRASFMHESRIGSKATFIAALRDLEAWGLIFYYPSRNSHEGSHITIVPLGGVDEPEVGQPADSSRARSGPTASVLHGPEVRQAVGPNVGHLNSSVGPEVVHHSLLDKTSTTKPVPENDTGDAARKKKKGVADPVLGKNSSRKSAGIHSSRIRDAAAHQARPAPTSRRGKATAPDLPFTQSEVADLTAFRAAFVGTDYELADLAFYHELVGSWRDKTTGEAPRRKDWVATAKRFMLNDARDNRLKLAPGVQQHGAGPIQS